MSVSDGEQDIEAIHATGEKGKLPVIGGTNVRLAHQFLGKIAKGTPLIAPLKTYHREDVLI